MTSGLLVGRSGASHQKGGRLARFCLKKGKTIPQNNKGLNKIMIMVIIMNNNDNSAIWHGRLDTALCILVAFQINAVLLFWHRCSMTTYHTGLPFSLMLYFDVTASRFVAL